MLKLIQPISKRDQVVAAIKAAIIAGALQPGDAIVETRMAQELGAGTPLVREALIELEHHGYVQKVPYKGTTVTKLERANVEQIFRLRLELETLAIAWARERMIPENLTYLCEITGKMMQAANSLDLDQFYENDLAFHRKIWQMSGNEYLADCLERIVVPLFAFFVMKNRRERKSYVESAANHQRIVEAFSQMSGANLSLLIRDSLTDWQSEVLEQLLPKEKTD